MQDEQTRSDVLTADEAARQIHESCKQILATPRTKDAGADVFHFVGDEDTLRGIELEKDAEYRLKTSGDSIFIGASSFMTFSRLFSI